MNPLTHPDISQVIFSFCNIYSKLILTRVYPKQFKIDKNPRDFCLYAVKNSYLELLKWAHENGYPWHQDVCDYLARKGHFETLKWAKENGCEINSYVCSRAARGGHLD